jgi:tetratricopeptide (TPR) repeat protein
MRKVICILSAIGISFSMHSAHAQDASTEEQQAAKTREYTEIEKEFTNLPEQKRIDYIKYVNEANRLFQQKRIFESMAQVHEARKIFDKNSDVFNLLGSCYVEFRDFDEAMGFYEKALALSPKSPIIHFNIAELEFVTRKWKSCLEKMRNVLTMLPKGDIATTRVVEIKILLCHIALNENTEADALAQKYDPLIDDSPYYYYAQACIAYRDKDEEKAQSFLLMALRVFRNPAILAPWDDTLMEYGFIKSYYGGEPLPEE